MSAFSDTDRVIGFFVNKIAEIFTASRVSFMLFDRANKELFVKASCGLNVSASAARLKLGEMFGGWVAEQGRPLLVKNVETEFPDLLRNDSNRVARYRTKSFVIVPVKSNPERGECSGGTKDGVIGVLSLTDRKNSDIFTEDDLKVIDFLCKHLALHIDNIRLREKNAELVTADPLTGLFNHRYFHEQLLEEIYQAERYRHPLSLLMLDIDDFCWYNQTYGYSAGDTALEQIAGIIKDNTRRVDLAVRYGSEEFMVILPDTRLKQALVVAQRIKETVEYSVFAEDRSSSFGMAKLTVSTGIAEYKIGLDKQELIRRVVSALLDAKQKGKNCVCAFK
ncbi:MAG: sensor domain-containing diguanylate cyclase [Planctomycetota bacterium]